MTTDGTAVMTGKVSGAVNKIKQLAPSSIGNHCIIHKEALAAKKLSDKGNEVSEMEKLIQQVVKIVNFIHSKAMNSRVFKELCEAAECNYHILLQHTEVRWLSWPDFSNLEKKSRYF